MSAVTNSDQFDYFVLLHAYGDAKPEQVAALEANPAAWRTTLARLVHETEGNLASARSLRGAEREQVVADLEAERQRLNAAYARFVPQREPRPARTDGARSESADANGRAANDERATKGRRAPLAPEDLGPPGRTQLQVSWEPGRVVAWAAGLRAPIAGSDEVVAMLSAAGAPRSGWTRHGSVGLPDRASADAMAIPVGDVLGWLVAAGAGQLDGELGASVRWLGRVAVWAVELAAQGAVVPMLRQRARRGGAKDSGGNAANGSFSVRWTPALIDPARLTSTAADMPPAVSALDRKVDAKSLIRSALTGMVDAIYRDSARRLEVPAPPPRVRTARDVGEAFLARLDGTAFEAPVRLASDVAGKVTQWARSVTIERARLIVQMAPPEDDGGWHLAVYAPGEPGKHGSGAAGKMTPIEQAITMAGSERDHLEAEISRLERMLPALRRPGSHRRGQVILGSDEAWDLMAATGPRLAAAGFDVRVPALAARRATPSLRVFVESSDTAVGASQLANVRWSAVFDGVELTAEQIRALAKDARPLIHTGAKWVAIDRADLRAAADALAERAATTQLSGAEMLRLALGLVDAPLAGGISVAGGGWAADLLAAAGRISDAPAREPDGFVGELRSYQAEALSWLGFLDSAGLGGCLALDMGLGKTPTLLAHLLAGAGSGPALVIAPPAVVGNWTAEAGRFTPGLRVVVHHGANRAAPEEIAAEVADADVVVTTYGTAVRDVEALAEVSWARVVLDEAQAIKNPANDTSQQLRRIPARSRIALTGTPIENGLGDLWAILDFANPGLVGPRPQFIAHLSNDTASTRVDAEVAMRALNGILVFRRTKSEPEIAAELPDRIDQVDHCAMTPEQIGMYQALLDTLVTGADLPEGETARKGQILAAITGLKQICNHPWAYQNDDRSLEGRSGKLARLEEIVDSVFAAGERVLVFTHFAEWGVRLAEHLAQRTGTPVACYHGGLSRVVRDRLIEEFQAGVGGGALVLSLKAGGTGLNLTAASHVVLYDRWWNPAVEDQARDRAWRIGQTRTVICHRLICPGTVDERVEEVVAGKRRIADLVLPKSSSLADLDSDQLRIALGVRPDALLAEDLLAADEPVPA